MLTCTASRASEWRFVPNANLIETYTDNVRLAPRGREQSDFVTQVAPGFTLDNDRPRLQVHIGYALQALLYKDSDISPQVSNLVNATVHATLIEDLLLMDARGSVGQQNISSFGPVATSNINFTGNRANVRTYTISPYLVHRFSNIATSQLRYSHDSVGTSNRDNNSGFNFSPFGNSNSDRLVLNVDNGPLFRSVTWGTYASTQKTKYSNNQSVDQSTYSGNVGYFLLPTFRLTASAGYEKNTYFTLGDRPQGGFYNAGFIWTPTVRTNVTATAGHRYFGKTYSLAANHRARLAAFSATYSEDITTSQAQFLSTQLVSTSALLNQAFLSTIPDSVARQQVVDALILQNGLPAGISNPVNALTTSYLLQKNFQASIALNGVRNTVVGSVFNSRRMPASGQQIPFAAVGTPLSSFDENSKQTGASALWNLQFSPRTSANVNLGYSHSTSSLTEQKTTYKTARLALSTALQPKLRGTVEFRHSLQVSDFTGGDIRENAITAALLMQF
ncbi:MAG: hypothetical protein NVSMB6_12390 [Burkholderiaceae bacterium]